MFTHTIDPSDLIMALHSMVDAETELCPDYSGRGMYGARCFGITCDSSAVPQVFFALGWTAAQADADGDEDAEHWADLARVARTDSMGLDVIVYFPGYGLADDAVAVS